MLADELWHYIPAQYGFAIKIVMSVVYTRPSALCVCKKWLLKGECSHTRVVHS